LYPGNQLKQDKHYFTRQEYDTEGENSPSNKAEWAKNKLSKRKDHFSHSLAKEIVEECVDKNVGEIAIGNLKGIREDETGEAKNWGVEWE
jgi:putative transposase